MKYYDQSGKEVEDIKQRAGRFQIGWDVIRLHPKEVLEAIKDVVIVRAESLYHGQVVEYVGFCDEFRETSVGDRVPSYQARLKTDEFGKTTRESWVEIEAL